MFKKAQLKIQQMMLFLLAVFIFLALAGLVFLSFYLNSLHNQVNLQREEKSMINAAMLADSAEFSCGKDCIDTDKLMVLKNMPQYNDFWPVDSIEVIKLFPQEQEIECTLSNYPNCNQYNVYSKNLSSSKKVSNFVILCRKQAFQEYVGKKCELGKLIIGYEVE